ncbi:hypothetical protein ASD62_05000 [Phycicoccus sp. Root563]|nr:hypothetical protein ASD62_05000 [Phycicoccus sp. Root563]
MEAFGEPVDIMNRCRAEPEARFHEGCQAVVPQCRICIHASGQGLAPRLNLLEKLRGRSELFQRIKKGLIARLWQVLLRVVG